LACRSQESNYTCHLLPHGMIASRLAPGINKKENWV
jgi:hypothetical protein